LFPEGVAYDQNMQYKAQYETEVMFDKINVDCICIYVISKR